MIFAVAYALVGIVFGSALTSQIFVPILMARVQDRSTVTRISNESLKRHHTLSLVFLAVAAGLFFEEGKLPALILTGILVVLNLYQRFWIFTKLHLVKQPIGVQDLIQPDNVLREESNRLQRLVYWIFRLHFVLLFIDLLVAAF
jgi:Ca2+/Na+ antiporter